MKATGIVRRIDDLGIVVIPKKSAARCGSVREARYKRDVSRQRNSTELAPVFARCFAIAKLDGVGNANSN